jgi:hypothetical protein
VLFDLDPSPGVGFKETVQVALLVKQALDALELESFVKTSGADGIHVLVPIARRYTYADTREFSAIIAGALAERWTGSNFAPGMCPSPVNSSGDRTSSTITPASTSAAASRPDTRWTFSSNSGSSCTRSAYADSPGIAPIRGGITPFRGRTSGYRRPRRAG